MDKKIQTVLKIQLPAGKATPAPPTGTALGPHGVDIQGFVTQFNEATRDMGEDIIPAEITIYVDRSFTFRLKTPPASDLLRKAAGIDKGSGVPNRDKVGKVSKKAIAEIAKKKMEDLSANDIEGAMKIIEGTARSMGIEVSD